MTDTKQIKYVDTMVVFEEIPDEITLAINISNCPCHCSGCHSKHLWEDIGNPLTFSALDSLIESNDGITCVCFMGGDSTPAVINSLAAYCREKHGNLKVGWYSGRDKLSEDIDVSNFDYIKIGRYDEKFGPLNNETTNQKLYKVGLNGTMINITDSFWRKKV